MYGYQPGCRGRYAIDCLSRTAVVVVVGGGGVMSNRRRLSWLYEAPSRGVDLG